MSKLLYQGHGSFRLTGNDGQVIYVDPFAGEGYDLPADLILVTHQHSDHNQVELCARKPGCRVISNREALTGGELCSFKEGNTLIQAVEAENRNHRREECVGYIITLDGIQIYAAGDTSRTAQMESFAALRLDYALLPGDGVYNMGLEEAAECARLIGARHNIVIHLEPGALFNRDKAEQWTAPNKLIVAAGQELAL